MQRGRGVHTVIGRGIAEALAERIVARKREREYAALLADQREQALQWIANTTSVAELLGIRSEVNKHSDAWGDELEAATLARYNELWRVQ